MLAFSTALLTLLPAQGRRRGGASMRVLVSDLVLFSCLLAFVTGIVIAVASLLS
jgi:hypothetical protein